MCVCVCVCARVCLCLCINRLACIRVKGGESECFRIDSGVRQWCIMFPLTFQCIDDAVLKEVKMGIGRRG